VACGHRRDALCDLCDALLAAGPVPSPAHLSLQPAHRRGWGRLYSALTGGEAIYSVDASIPAYGRVATPRRVLGAAGTPTPRATRPVNRSTGGRWLGLPVGGAGGGRARELDRPNGRPPPPAARVRQHGRRRADSRAAPVLATRRRAALVRLRRRLRLGATGARPPQRPRGHSRAFARRTQLLRRPAVSTRDWPPPPAWAQVRLLRRRQLAPAASGDAHRRSALRIRPRSGVDRAAPQDARARHT
jgi:hypothetical protein